MTSFKSIWGKGKSWIAALTAILGGLAVYFEFFHDIKSVTQTDHDQFIEEQYIQGIIIPYDVQKSYPYAEFHVGNEIY